MARSARAAMASALAAPAPPVSTGGYVDALGGSREGTRRLALLRAGLNPDAPLPKAGTADFRAYRSARRTIERWRNFESGAPGQKRRPAESWLREQRPAVRADATRRRLDKLQRRGVRVRMRVKLRISRDERWRIIPAPPGPGVLLSKASTAEVVDPFGRGDFAAAAGTLEAATISAWAKGNAGEFSVTDLDWVRVWPDGEAEPTE